MSEHSDLRELTALWVHAPLQRLSPRLHRQLRSLAIRGRLLHLDAPRTFIDKVNWRALHDRREVLVPTGDKLAMKDVAAARGGPDLLVPHVLWSGTDVAELAGASATDLPERWVLKPNHRSGLVHFGSGPVAAADVDALRATTRGWLREHLASVEGEWVYSRARACLFIEERLPGEGVPADTKVFVFDGVPFCVVTDGARFGASWRTVHTPAWERLDVVLDGARPGPDLPAPAELPVLLDVAARLGAGFDFIRVDLYAVDGQVWFGELTPYPGGGYGTVAPRWFDEVLGAAWTLPAHPR